MSELRALQKEFQAYVLTLEAGMAGHVEGSDRFPADAQIGVYAEAYRLRLVEALTKHYPGLCAWMGSEAWHGLCLAFIQASTPTHFSLRAFGAGLESFVRESWRAEGAGCFAGMAAFEWALNQAFDARDETLLTREEVARLAPEQWPDLRLTFHPSVQRLDLQAGVVAAWRALQAGETVPRVEDPVARPWLVWRHDLQPFFRPLAPSESSALELAQAGGTFSDLCESLYRWLEPERIATEAGHYLHRWVADGLVTEMQ